MEFILFYYWAIKLIFFYTLVLRLVKFEPLKRHCIFLGLLYASGIAFLSWVFFLAALDEPDYPPWRFWLLKTAIIAAIYFRLLVRFEDGILFWILLMAGLAVVAY